MMLNRHKKEIESTVFINNQSKIARIRQTLQHTCKYKVWDQKQLKLKKDNHEVYFTVFRFMFTFDYLKR